MSYTDAFSALRYAVIHLPLDLRLSVSGSISSEIEREGRPSSRFVTYLRSPFVLS